MRRLILFVHGLGGTADGTWGEFPRLIREDGGLSGFDVALLNQPSAPFRFPFMRVSARIGEFADALSSEIDSRFRDYDDIVLVGHSMGGLIVRKFLVEQLKAGRIPRVSRAMLYACPNLGSSIAGLGKAVAWRHWQLAQLTPESDFLEGLNQDWLTLDCCGRIVVRNIVAALDRYVLPSSANPRWPGSTFRTVGDQGHVDLVKPGSAQASSFIFLREFVLDDVKEPLDVGILPDVQTTCVAGPPGPSPDPLFISYAAVHERFYKSREFDQRVERLIQHRSFWLVGEPGCGKTACVVRALGRAFGQPHVVPLGDLVGSEVDETLVALHDRIAALVGAPACTASTDVIDAIASRLDEAGGQGIGGILIEELPLEGRQLQTFCRMLRAIGVRHASRVTGKSTRIVVSSRTDPGGAFSGNSQGAETYVVVRMDQWDDADVVDLVRMISAALAIPLNPLEVARISHCAKGSPRYVKMLFGNLLALGPESLEQAVSHTTEELRW
jgi:pimeloyl-ACP methyl ester carboxylesterase